MSEYNTKSEMSENVVIRTFRENSSGAVYRFPVFGLMPNDIHATTYWFAKELQPDLYEVSSLIPSSLIPSSKYYEVPRIEIDVLGFSYYHPETEKIVVLPDGVDGTDCYTGVDKNGHLVQIKKSTLFDKELFTELKESKIETETEKTFIPESGDWIIADIRHRDGRLSAHVGEVVKRSYGYFTGDSYYDPMVFDEKGNVESQVTHIEVFRNHKIVFSYSKDEHITMKEAKTETETEKTFMPEPGDYISAVVRLSDTDCKTYRGYVCRQAKGFSASPWALVPVVFDVNGKLLPYVTDVAVMRNHEIVFSHNKETEYKSTDNYPGGVSDDYQTFDKLYYYHMLLKSSDK